MNPHDLVELDRLNMSPIIERAGGRFVPGFRLAKLREEIDSGAEFITLERQDQLVAYLEFLPEPDGICKILSLQIHPDWQRTSLLRTLLRLALDRLKSASPSFRLIRSAAHVVNPTSLSLHEKLGFTATTRTPDRIEYQIPPTTLLTRLHSILH